VPMPRPPEPIPELLKAEPPSRARRAVSDPDLEPVPLHAPLHPLPEVIVSERSTSMGEFIPTTSGSLVPMPAPVPSQSDLIEVSRTRRSPSVVTVIDPEETRRRWRKILVRGASIAACILVLVG